MAQEHRLRLELGALEEVGGVVDVISAGPAWAVSPLRSRDGTDTLHNALIIYILLLSSSVVKGSLGNFSIVLVLSCRESIGHHCFYVRLVCNSANCYILTVLISQQSDSTSACIHCSAVPLARTAYPSLIVHEKIACRSETINRTQQKSSRKRLEPPRSPTFYAGYGRQTTADLGSAINNGMW